MTRPAPRAAQTLLEVALPLVARRAADLAGLTTFEEVVTAVVRGARELLASDVAYLTLIDEATGEFAVRGSEGFLSHAFLADRSTRRGVGIYGYVVDHARPFWSGDYLPDARFSHLPEINASIAAEGIRGLLGAPAPRPGRALPGVVFAGWRAAREVDDDEIALLVAWGVVAGAALENACARQTMAVERDGARQQVAVLGEEVAGLRRLGTAIARLARTAAQTGVADDVLAVLSDDLSAGVLLYDATGTVQASWGSSQGTVGLEARLRALVQRSAEEGRAVADDAVCVAAIASQSGLLGSVVAVLPSPPAEIDLSVLDAGAVNLGILLLSRERLVAAENRDMGDTLRGLLTAARDDLGTLSTHASRYGLRLGEERTAVAVVDVGGLAVGTALDRTRQAVAAHPALFGFHDGLLVLLADGPASSAVVERVRDALSRDGAAPATVCVDSGPHAGAELPAAVRRVRQCLQVALTLGRVGGTHPAAELAPYAVAFGNLGAQEVDEFIASTIGPLLAYDETRGTHMAETLSTFLGCSGNARATAEALYVHVNTVRQRLVTLGRLLPAWDEPSRRLDIHLALRLHDLRRTAP